MDRPAEPMARRFDGDSSTSSSRSRRRRGGTPWSVGLRRSRWITCAGSVASATHGDRLAGAGRSPGDEAPQSKHQAPRPGIARWASILLLARQRRRTVNEAAAYKQRVRDGYDEIAERWHRWTPVMREQYAPATELMLDLARLRRGNRVLDIAAGDGYQSIAAAERVGPTGHVLAGDISPEQLRYAAAAAREAGVDHVETRVMDAENLDLPDASFDAVLCQFGLMFLPDVDRGLREMLRVLRSGAWASLVIFAAAGTPESDVAESVVRRRMGTAAPAPVVAAGATLGPPGALQRKLDAVGFRSVESHELVIPFRMASAQDALAYIRDLHPSLVRMLAPLAADEREDVWREVGDSLASFVTADGYESQSRVVVAAGARPS
jgi:ubiquinone/menaquinone biosynthesis C-methylase UbiE